MFGKRKEQRDTTQEDLQKLRKFGFQKMGNFTAEDVFLIGYPKSGNTLMQFLLAFLVYGLRKDTSLSLINACVTEFYNNPYFFRLNERHFIKSHELPNEDYKKVIYMVRDGREAVRSFYYMLKNMQQEVSLEAWYRSGGNSFVGTWQNHVQSWVDNKYNADILFIKYEDLIQNKAQEIRRLCNFLEIDRNTEEIQSVLTATSLENMKQLEQSFSWARSKSFKKWDQKGSFVREGKIAGYRDDTLIQDDWIEDFENQSNQMLKRFQYL